MGKKPEALVFDSRGIKRVLKLVNNKFERVEQVENANSKFNCRGLAWTMKETRVR